MVKIGVFASAIRRIGAPDNYRKGTTALPSLINPPLPLGFSSILLFHSRSNARNPNSPSPPAATTTRPKPRSSLPRKHRNFGPNDLQESEELLNRIALTRQFPPIFEINKALGTIAKMGNYGTTLSHVEKLQLLGVQVNIYTLNIAINCYCRLNRVDLGFSLLGSLFKRGYAPDVATFNSLITGLIIQDKTADAVELFKKLVRTREIVPNVVMYGIIVNGLCKTGNTSIALKLLRVMEEGSCKPDTVVYNTIIDSLCKDRMVDVALRLFSEISEKGIRPTVVTFNCLIHGLCNCGRWRDAKGMLREMLDSGIFPDVHTFNVLVDALIREGKATEAQGVVDVMIERGMDPDVVTYNTLMDGYCLQGQMDEAMRVFNTIVDRGLHPNIISQNILIKGYCKKMKIDEAMHLFRECLKGG